MTSRADMKWSKQQDNELLMHIQKLGTAWHLIQKKFSTKRSRNALIKRWHGRLKEDYGDLQIDSENYAEEDEEQSVKQSNNTRRSAMMKQSQLEKGSEQQILAIQPQVVFPKDWKFEDDERLKVMVLEKHEFDWDLLSKEFGVPRDEVIRQWQKKIYPQIKLNDKVAGALKWSRQEDDILVNCEKIYPQDWQRLWVFLPARSVFSIEARLKRINSNQTADNPSALSMTLRGEPNRQLNKYEYRKCVIRKIAKRLNQAKGTLTLKSIEDN